jgi:uncharacterized membrane protein
MRSRVAWLLALGMIGLALAGTWAVYPRLPDRIPTHWNFQGEVDGWGPRWWAAWALPALMVAMLVFFWALPWLSPRKFEVGSFQATYEVIGLLVLALFGFLHAVAISQALDEGLDVKRFLYGGLCLFFALMGNVMGRVRRNFYVGVRVPWTIASERVWNDTHRFTAWLWTGAGAAGLACVVAGWPVVGMGLVLAMLPVPVAYSLWRYKALEKAGRLDVEEPAAAG